MILIFSNNQEITTNEVIKWFIALGKPFIRVHEDEFFEIKVLNRKILTLCEKIAYNVIKKAKKNNSGSICWPTKFGKGHTGISHGNSGVALALTKLNFYIKSSLIQDAIIDCLNYEAELFDKKNKYWYSFKLFENDKSKVVEEENHFWAYGSGGITLSRILIYELNKCPVILEDIKIGINNIIEKGWSGNFNYSSGVFGNLDILNEYAHKTNDKELKMKIYGFVNNILKEKNKNFDSWCCVPIGRNYNSNFEVNGFFTGLAGINNTLLNILNYEKTSKLFM